MRSGLCRWRAPMIMRAGQTKAVPDLTDPEYVAKLSVRGSHRTNWMIIQSLKATEDFEWETVDYNNPTTWANWTKEARDSGLSETEIVRIMNAVLEANSLDESKVDKARQDFLAGLQVKAVS